MPIGSSSGEYFQDQGDLLVDSYGPMTAKEKSDRTEIQANETSGDFRSRFPDRPIVYISPHQGIEDRRGSPWGAFSGTTLSGLEQKGRDILKYGLGPSGIERGNLINADENQVPETELSKQLGSTSIRMPPGGPTEPAGEFKSEGGTQVPEKGSTLKIGDKTPEGETVRFTTASPLVNITGEDINRGIEVGLSAGPGTMAGVKSKTINLADLGHAQVLEANGVHSDVIRQKTGFERGVEGRWRHEIDDSKSNFDWGQLTTRPIQPLPKVLDHPELFKAYPQLRNIKVIHDPSYKGVAEWDGQNIIMGDKAIKSNNQHGILMHEIQHAIQDIEGFAKGGSPGQAGKDFELKYARAARAVIPEANKLLEKRNTGTITPEETAKLAYYREIAETYVKYHAAGNEQAVINYNRLAGETEARNVDTRLLLTAEERRNINPKWTEDIARVHQIPIDLPALATAYGVKDPKTGRIIK